MKAFSLFMGLAILVSVNLLFSDHLPAQSADDKTSLTVTYANGDKVKARGRNGPLPTLGIGAGETVNLRLDLPARFRKIPLVVQALDGGSLAQEDFAPGNGKVITSFQAGVQPGLYRLLLSGGDDRTALLRFRVPGGAQ